MSNLIKASLIRYTDEARKVDANPLADAFQKKFIDKYIEDNIALKQISFDEVSRQLEQGDGFKPGLAGEQVSVAPPAPQRSDVELEERRKEYDELKLEIDELHGQADTLLEDAQAEADHIREQARLETDAEREEILSRAHDDGYEDGYKEAQAEIDHLRSELEERREQLEAEYAARVDELEPRFVDLVIRYLNKLTGIYAEDKKDIILYLIESSLKNRQLTGSVLIKVSPEDAQTVREAHDRLAAVMGEDVEFEIIEDSLLSKNRCLIETDSRVFDCGLDDRLKELTDDLLLLAEKD